MFEFVKQVLTNVSFDKDLFRKELSKGLKNLGKADRASLYVWSLATFAQYQDVILETFSQL